MQIVLHHIGKSFVQANWIFRDINLQFNAKDKVALLGNNGSGKSSLLQIISGHLSATEGYVEYFSNKQPIGEHDVYASLAYVSPSLELIEEFTLLEFMQFHFSIKRPLLSIDDMLEYVGLSAHKNKKIEHFSSGMKQRVKLSQAIFSNSPVLLLDEPCSNLDDEGYILYNKMIQEFATDRLVIVASNDKNEYDFCNTRIDVRQFK